MRRIRDMESRPDTSGDAALAVAISLFDWPWQNNATENDSIIARLEQDIENQKKKIDEIKKQQRIMEEEAKTLKFLQDEKEKIKQARNQPKKDNQISIDILHRPCVNRSNANPPNNSDSLQNQMIELQNHLAALELKQNNDVIQLQQANEAKSRMIQKKIRCCLCRYFIFSLILTLCFISLNNFLVIFPAIAETSDEIHIKLYEIGHRVMQVEENITMLRTETYRLEKEYSKLDNNFGNWIEKEKQKQITVEELQIKWSHFSMLLEKCQNNSVEEQRLRKLDASYWSAHGVRLYSMGCFWNNTLIQLDQNPNHTKPIWFIPVNQTIWNPFLERTVRVTRIIAGPEHGFRYQITTSSSSSSLSSALSHSLDVTKFHPMVKYLCHNGCSTTTISSSSRTVLPVYQLQKGDWTSTIDGPQEIIEIKKIPILGSEMVYNLEIEGTTTTPLERMIIANGIYTSDLWTQEQLVQKE